jgi:hypothetical protein
MADEIIINEAPSIEPSVEESIKVEEIPSWVNQLSLEIRESNLLQRETLEVLRNQTNLLPQVMETNARLTQQLTETPQQVIELVRPLLSPIVSETEHLTDTLPAEEDGTSRLEAPAEIPAVEVVPERRRSRPRPI